MSTRRFKKVVYIRTSHERHAALHAYAAHQGTSVTDLVDTLIDHLLAEAAATPALAKLDRRLTALEQARHLPPGSEHVPKP